MNSPVPLYQHGRAVTFLWESLGSTDRSLAAGAWHLDAPQWRLLLFQPAPAHLPGWPDSVFFFFFYATLCLYHRQRIFLRYSLTLPDCCLKASRGSPLLTQHSNPVQFMECTQTHTPHSCTSEFHLPFLQAFIVYVPFPQPCVSFLALPHVHSQIAKTETLIPDRALTLSFCKKSGLISSAESTCSIYYWPLTTVFINTPQENIILAWNIILFYLGYYYSTCRNYYYFHLKRRL